MAKIFQNEAIVESNPLWNICTQRLTPIYQRNFEIRSEFWRDYNRLLHSKAYRRLKHKTQVFQATNNDHVCTRIEHVNHVCSVSYSICNYLGLNAELALAIGIGHDIGHAPFGHDGEKILNDLSQKNGGKTFYHEGNGLFFADYIEMLPDENGQEHALNLTYAVRDGIVCHCGEVDQSDLRPRKEVLDLETIKKANALSPFTWEACVVKIADKISYLGRDLEDAVRLHILEKEQLEELADIQHRHWGKTAKSSSNTALIHSFAADLCQNSSPKNGICFSKKYFQTITEIKHFNYKYIYNHQRLKHYTTFAEVIIRSIFETCLNIFAENIVNINKNIEKQKNIFPKLMLSFQKWLLTYSNLNKTNQHVVFHINNKNNFVDAIILFIASMSDNYALEMFEELTTF